MKKLAKFAIIALFGLNLLGADYYVSSQTQILNKIGGKAIGELYTGAKLKEINSKGEWVEVEYIGYIPGESPIAYARVGVLEQDINVKNLKTFKVIKKHKDDYDNEWDEVKVKGFVKKSALSDDINTIYAAGENLFKERCGGCHALHNYDEFNANVWPSVVETMMGNAALSPDEMRTLNRFLQSKAPID